MVLGISAVPISNIVLGCQPGKSLLASVKIRRRMENLIGLKGKLILAGRVSSVFLVFYVTRVKEQRAESREQRAESRELRVNGREQRAESSEQRAESRELTRQRIRWPHATVVVPSP
jgi:hypothetical protein